MRPLIFGALVLGTFTEWALNATLRSVAAAQCTSPYQSTYRAFLAASFAIAAGVSTAAISYFGLYVLCCFFCTRSAAAADDDDVIVFDESTLGVDGDEVERTGNEWCCCSVDVHEFAALISIYVLGVVFTSIGLGIGEFDATIEKSTFLPTGCSHGLPALFSVAYVSTFLAFPYVISVTMCALPAALSRPSVNEFV